MARDTRDSVGDLADKIESRSLYFDRFADPLAKDKDRKVYFDKVARKGANQTKIKAWTAILSSLVGNGSGRILYAQLQSRLMVNMASGVMENAGLCLDRFGIPFLPGSSVKGCARRVALAALHEWCEAGGLPENRPEGTDNLFTPVCKPFGGPAELLASIARVFGWGDQEWETDSDWAWACTPEQWKSIIAGVRDILGEPVSQSYAGCISFLPGFPVELGQTRRIDNLALELPDPGKLDLDIVTCHHRNYYGGKIEIATDTEEPIPVPFPAVSPGHVYGFGLIPLRGSAIRELDITMAWLSAGLAAFGLGAKANAGYGWFDSSISVHSSVENTLRNLLAQRDVEQRTAEEQARQQAAEVEQRKQAERLRAALANLSPEQAEDFKLQQVNDDQFRGRLNAFVDREDAEKRAIVRALRKDPTEEGSRRKFWDDLKKKAQKGGAPARLELAIRALSKQMYTEGGKMP